MESIRDTRSIGALSDALDTLTTAYQEGVITLEEFNASIGISQAPDHPGILYEAPTSPWAISEMSRALDFLTEEYQEGRMTLEQFNEYLRML